MRPFRPLPALLVLFLAAAVGRADAPPDPLRLVPAQANLVLQVEQPRRLAEGVATLDLLKEFQKLDPVRELMDSTNARRLFQLIGYFEKQLGGDRFDLLDRLAGGGIVLAVKYGAEPTP